ncbi:GAF domain-containing protein [Marmoricola sp. OAE513]|uniref:GAF and ANTAR domain-containing protein n=1 Tax=Marmoricola sp. OAE513 TaxID=2817894 RepID=UPI001AE3329F
MSPTQNRRAPEGSPNIPPLRRVAATARDLLSERSTDSTLERILLLAVEVIPGAADSSISLRHRDGSIETPAATSERGAHADRLQYETGVGPCLSALNEHEIVSAPDLSSDDRWGSWAPRTSVETGARSMLCFRLFTNEKVLGALNLYANQPHAFTTDDVDLGRAFAAQAAVALARASQIGNLEAALDSRSRIGEAVGILMERFDLTSDRGFEVLARYSQNGNRKLRDVATELVETRHLPHELEPPAPH